MMDGDGNSKDDVKVPDTDLGKEIEKAFEDGKDAMVTIIAAMGTSLFSTQPRSSETDIQTRSSPSLGRRLPRLKPTLPPCHPHNEEREKEERRVVSTPLFFCIQPYFPSLCFCFIPSRVLK
jgi:hypothetical protein